MRFKNGLAVMAAVACMGVSSQAAVLFAENFDDVNPLLIPVDEVGRGWDNIPVWTTSPENGMPGWSFDKTIDGDGALEWEGWSVAIKDAWVQIAGNQNRSQFTNSTGNCFIADPDEYDDYNGGINNAGYNVFATTPVFSLEGVAAGSATLNFDSSWRPEGFDDDDLTNNQTGKIEVSYDGGTTWTTVLHWDSDDLGPNYHPDATNENVTVQLNNPAGSRCAMLRFSLTLANNDWWWAVDNLKVEGTVTGSRNVAPNAFNIVSGAYFGGTAGSLCLSDDDKLYILNDENMPNSNAIFTFNVPGGSTGPVQVKVEYASTRTDLSTFVDVYEYGTTNNFVNRDLSTSSASDVVRTINLPGTTNPFNANGDAQVRFRTFPNEDLIAEDGWQENIDQVKIVAP